MGRIINEQEYAIKRKEILEVARSLVFTRGYEQMAIQDILDRMQISKGAFYHYFTSKQSLLEALTLHLLEGAEQIINPIVQDPCLPTLEKLKLFFATLSKRLLAGLASHLVQR
jgi:TetR/AcrR family transcriptional repressor of nem operon